MRDRTLQHYTAALDDHPLHPGTLRGLMRIARSSGSDSAQSFGLALLRALGTASPDERNDAPRALPSELATDPHMLGGLAEEARQLMRRCAQQLQSCMAVTPNEADLADADPSGPGVLLLWRAESVGVDTGNAMLCRFSRILTEIFLPAF